jgi:hypothetical protein
MKKDGSRKLALSRETLKPLQADELNAVNGADSVSISWNGYSISYSRSQSQSQSISFSSRSQSFSISGSR